MGKEQGRPNLSPLRRHLRYIWPRRTPHRPACGEHWLKFIQLDQYCFFPLIELLILIFASSKGLLPDHSVVSFWSNVKTGPVPEAPFFTKNLVE